MRQEQILEFAGAGRQRIECNGKKLLSVSVSGASGGNVTSLEYSHADDANWYDHNGTDSQITDNGQIVARAAAATDNYWLAIASTGVAKVIVSTIDA